MTDRAKLALRIQLLKLRGPKNEKDLMLQWALQTGRIKLDRDWDRIGPNQDAPTMKDERERFKAGLFNFRRYLTQDERVNNDAYPGEQTNTSPNPFSTSSGEMGGFQIDDLRFPGNTVQGGNKRYPGFLSEVLTGYI